MGIVMVILLESMKEVRSECNLVHQLEELWAVVWDKFFEHNYKSNCTNHQDRPKEQE